MRGRQARTGRARIRPPRRPGPASALVFSIIQKKVLTPNDFPGTGTLSHALHAFVHRYNPTARPFNWKFSADDLTALLRRTSLHEQVPASQHAHSPQAA